MTDRLGRLWCSWFHGGGDIKRDASGRINWQCRKCGRWGVPVPADDEQRMIDSDIRTAPAEKRAEKREDWDRVAALEESLREHMAEIYRLRAALAERGQEQDVRIPKGWKLVPEQPTEEMLAATSWPGCATTDYAHMIAAAPMPPRREWVGLTKEERQGILDTTHPDSRWTLVERVEAALKRKNHD